MRRTLYNRGVYTDRSRAESFGSVAERYDRFRPSYPDALMDDLAALRQARARELLAERCR